MLSAVLVIHLVLMVPAYVVTNEEVSVREHTLRGLGEKLAGSEDKQVSVRVNALTEKVTKLAGSARAHTTSDALRAILLVPHPGVRITGLSFTPGVSGKMILVGTATTRETLRSYVATLGTLPYVSNVDLPISAYAKESNIEFSIVLTGTFAL